MSDLLVDVGDLIVVHVRGAWHRAIVQAATETAVRAMTDEERVFVLPLALTPMEIVEPDEPRQRTRAEAGPEMPPEPLPNPRDVG